MVDVSGGNDEEAVVLPSFAARHRGLVQAALDGSAWAAGLAIAWLLRFDFSISSIRWNDLAASIAIAAVLQAIAGFASGLYLTRWRYGSFDEVSALVRTVVIAGCALFVIVQLEGRPYLAPRGVVAGGTIVAIGAMGALRWAWRMYIDRKRRPNGALVQRIVVVGAGEAGAQIVTSMMRDPESPYLPVALLDDDITKRNLRILGVPVAGRTSSVAATAEKYNAKTVLIAVPSASSTLVRSVNDQAEAVGLTVKIVPPTDQLFDEIGVSDIREVTISDLLGRGELDTDLDAIAGYLRDRVVLVTGAGGSIGSELCRQIHRFEPSRLVMVDRDESALHAVQLSIEGRALLDTPNLVLLDIRDRQRVMEVFAEIRPEVVFHAAALKHLPMLEAHPTEGVKTNIHGTINVLDAAVAVAVDRFVNISTDKAADPTSVLGYTKRIAERLTADVANHTPIGTYQSVRFGNVLGSRGSVLTAFRVQVDAGGPVTVTHPDVTRYFMTIEEACQLVIQAGAIGKDGEVLVLDMGEPVRIADVAARMIANSGKEIEIVYTGLRPGEKLHEDLFAAGEFGVVREHPLISHVEVPTLSRSEVEVLEFDTTLGLRLLATALDASVS